MSNVQEQLLAPDRALSLEHAESGEAEEEWVPLGEEGEPGFRAALFSRQVLGRRKEPW